MPTIRGEIGIPFQPVCLLVLCKEKYKTTPVYTCYGQVNLPVLDVPTVALRLWPTSPLQAKGMAGKRERRKDGGMEGAM